jgi:hypothetical protein
MVLIIDIYGVARRADQRHSLPNATIFGSRKEEEEFGGLSEEQIPWITADKLHRFEALAALDENAMSHGLTNPIHPVFEKKQWLREEEMPRHRGAVPILIGESQSP